MPSKTAENEGARAPNDFCFRAALLASTLDVEARTVEVTWTTGSRALRYSYEGPYVEDLLVTSAAVDLKRLNSGAPVLDAHSGYSGRGVIGVVVRGSAKIENGVGRATIRFDSDEDELARTIFRKVRDGILTGISVGYRIHRRARTKELDDGVPVVQITKWEPFELSVVPMPEDAGAGFRALDPSDQMPPELDTPAPATPSTEVRAAAPAAPAAPPVVPSAPPAVVDVDAVRTAAILAERSRIDTIRGSAEAAGFPALADDLIRRGLSVEQAAGEILAAHNQRKAANPVVAPGGGAPQPATSTEIGIDSARRGIAEYLAYRGGSKEKLDDNANQYRGLTILECGREFLEACNVKTRGMSKRQLVDAIMTRAGGMHTTSDFPLILADVANKRLQAAYTELPQTFAPLVTRTTLPDFKTANIVSIGDTPELLEIKEHGEYQAGTVGEGREQWALRTYGRKFAITRQTMINDDVDAFTRIPAGWGRAANRLESNLFWTNFLANPTMGDSVALYNAAHGNIGAGAIGLAGVSAGRKAMRKQTNLSGNPIDVIPVFLIAPVALETTADQFVNPYGIVPATNAEKNPFMGKLTVISDPRMDAVSEAMWYMQASPSQVETYLVATLEGESGPYTETRTGFDVDGVEIKARHDFAVKTVDHRGTYRSTGV